jgi:hypothetical protein
MKLNGTGRLQGTIVDSVFLGAFTRLLVQLEGGKEIAVHLSEAQGAPVPVPGERVQMSWQDQNARCLDAP